MKKFKKTNAIVLITAMLTSTLVSLSSQTAGTVNHVYASETNISEWVTSESVPSNAEIIQRKWVYSLTQRVESETEKDSSWNLISSYWKDYDKVTVNYAKFPDNYLKEADSNNKNGSFLEIYKSFVDGKIVAYEDANSKRTIDEDIFGGYVYWHWMYANSSGDLNSKNGSYNRYISSKKGKYSNRNFVYFNAFISDKAYRTSTLKDYASSGLQVYTTDNDRSGWDACNLTKAWFRFEYRTCTYHDSKKVFIYERTADNLESNVEVNNGDTTDDGSIISNVICMVQYIISVPTETPSSTSTNTLTPVPEEGNDQTNDNAENVIVSEWVEKDKVPSNAEITQIKWLYYTSTQRIETENEKDSDWKLIDTYWMDDDKVTVNYAKFPDNYLKEADSNNKNGSFLEIYKSFVDGKIVAYEDANSKRTIDEDIFGGYVYWHWMYANTSSDLNSKNGSYNRYISSKKGKYSNRNFVYFNAFISDKAYRTSTLKDYASSGLQVYTTDNDRSGWDACNLTKAWFRFEYRTCTYHDSKKVFVYEKMIDDVESYFPAKNDDVIEDSGDIYNVVCLVKYLLPKSTNTTEPEITNIPSPTVSNTTESPTSPSSSYVGAYDYIESILGQNYQQQFAKYWPTKQDRIVGLCNVCAMTNLLNRKLVIDGVYTNDMSFGAMYVFYTMGLYNPKNKLSKERAFSLSKEDEFDGVKILSQVDTDGYIYYKATYSLSKNSKKYRLVAANDKSIDSIINLLNEHPEGIFLRYFYNGKDNSKGGHCILITKYENNEFYVVDTVKKPYATTLKNSYSASYFKNGLQEGKIDFVAYLVEENTEPKMTQYYFNTGEDERSNTTSYIGPTCKPGD